MECANIGTPPIDPPNNASYMTQDERNFETKHIVRT